MNRINWIAIRNHAALGAAIALVAYVLHPILLAVWIVAAGVIWAGREVLTAKWRNKSTLRAAALIVWNGEPGWSPWNLRLQAIGAMAGALAMALVIWALH